MVVWLGHLRAAFLRIAPTSQVGRTAAGFAEPEDGRRRY